MVRGDMDKSLRTKVMCMITLETHSRDVIENLAKEGVDSPDEYQWQSQLKAYWRDDKDDCEFRISNATFDYGYDYIGNGQRLVITPLTDRIYVTATQALKLKMGCCPAGPAGTGKTESIKDLARALGKDCYVFNCSDQMDYKSMGGIFKGLASSGSWGCFDEFNRIDVEVLSVVAVQFQSIIDAMKLGVKKFTFQDDEISLDSSCGIFITMNPGYAGRTELPTALKSLFRTIAVFAPDFENICEIMLMTEGFAEAKPLAKKLMTMFTLCKEHLSSQRHYDWGLRVIKSVVRIAGALKRADQSLDETTLLMRAVRDCNLSRIVSRDLDLFMGLIGDIFPNIDCPRHRDMEFEGYIETAAEKLNLFPDPEFIQKVTQFKEILEVRHGVFLLGSAGCGKSSIWKTLAEAHEISGEKTKYYDLNPKSISHKELYGYTETPTNEWKDGILPKIMKSLSQEPNLDKEWIILDGDVDA